MHPILSTLRSLVLYTATWFFISLLFAWALMATQSTNWIRALCFTTPLMQLYGFILTSGYYLCRSLPLSSRKISHITVVFCSASFISALAWLGICLLWNSFLNDIHLFPYSIDIGTTFSLIIFLIGMLLYLSSLLAYDVLIAFENIRDAERRELSSQLLARDAELQMLRNQINPHFLFNSLNSISALTSFDATAARSMTIELGSFYRKTLSLSTHQKIAFCEELELCEHYLAIEKIRFDEKLHINWSIEPESLAAQVPTLFLQPLLENAVKHGICNLQDGGTIDVKSFVLNERLHILISNPIGVDVQGEASTRIGLKNLEERINNIYPENARLRCKAEHDRFNVELIIPFEKKVAEAQDE
jgi:two-component system, LytTR family, sensor histidine kinase AlgZ